MHRHVLCIIIRMQLRSIVLVLAICFANCLVPKPSQHTVGSAWYGLENSLEIRHDRPTCFILHDAIKRFVKRLQRHQHNPSNATEPLACISVLEIQILSQCDERAYVMWPKRNVSENYTVTVTSNSIRIGADEIWGALHGLETVIQLIYRTTRYQPVIQEQQITDSPRFPHRGYLIDTSRHFLPLPSILRFLDAMAMVKMNVLHWHIVDTESFPYMSIIYPLLAQKGSYAPWISVYTQNDVLKVLHHARGLGIRVMPEFDTPGHAESWGRGYPQLLTECYDESEPTGRYGPMNPAIRFTYDFLLSLFEEILYVFPEELVHLGGDEVDFSCWHSNPVIKKFMKEKNFGENYTRLQSYFTEQLIELVKLAKPKGRSAVPVLWQEVFDNGFDESNVQEEIIFHVWKSTNWKTEMKNITRAGYTVLFSSCWYLNIISYGVDWHQFYECNPTDFGGTSEEIRRVHGGEAAMWGEYVDETNIFSRSWPRGAAVAERLWSTGNLSVTDFTQRLDQLRCQMIRRGWIAEPPNGPGHCPQ